MRGKQVRAGGAASNSAGEWEHLRSAPSQLAVTAAAGHGALPRESALSRAGEPVERASGRSTREQGIRREQK